MEAMRRIEDIQTATHALAVVPNKPRVAYDKVSYLNPSSIAKGLVDHIEIDPAAIKFAFENPNTTAQQAAIDRMDRGTLAHMMLLQPERLTADVAQWPARKIRRKGTEKTPSDWDEFRAINHGKLIICEEDYADVSLAVAAFQFQKPIRTLLVDLSAEVAMFSREHSFYVKGLVDVITNEIEGVDGPVRRIIDLKTTEAGISERQVDYTIRDFRNREKMAAYRRWYAREKDYPKEQLKCINLFLSMTPPYAIRVVDIPSMTLDWGERRIVAALDEVQKCLDADKWPMHVAQGEALVESWEDPEEEMLVNAGVK